jgi:hypothetical protein
MNQFVKLKVNILIGNRYHCAGEIVELDTARVRRLLSLGHAEAARPPVPTVEAAEAAGPAAAERAAMKRARGDRP